MGKVQIVIWVDDNIYTRLFDNGSDVSILETELIKKSIRNGTPLPEHHGRLIDADAYIDEINRVFPCRDKYDRQIRRATEIGINNTPTIIEAEVD